MEVSERNCVQWKRSDLNCPRGVSVEDAKLSLAIQLFEDGRVSLGKAAEMAGYSRSTFGGILSRRGIDVVNYPPDDLERELELGYRRLWWTPRS